MRVCGDERCGKQDLFFYNSRNRTDFSHGRCAFLDYLAGHVVAMQDANDPAMLRALARLSGAPVPPPADSTDSVGDDMVRVDQIQALQYAEFSREYLPPAYLLDPIRQFLEGDDRGVFWLIAPAHTGKTVLAGRLEEELRKTGGLDDLIVATLHIKREYNFTEARWNAFLTDDLLKQRLGEQWQAFFPWNRRDDPLPPAEGFLQLANRIAARHPDKRLLLCLDGLDELPAPTRGDRSIADFLPPATDLPENVFLLLTSRPQDQTDPAIWANAERSATGAHFARLSVTPTDAGYRALLRTYLAAHLSVQKNNVPLFDTLLDRADGTFLYFAHLVRLLAEKQIALADVANLPSGEALFSHYLVSLRNRLGEKHFGPLEGILCVLAAAEEAYNQFVTLVPPGHFSGEWHGLPAPVLAGLLNDSSAGARVSLRLVHSLTLLRELLRTWRADDAPTASYRIGLKGLVPALRRDATWSALLDADHARIAGLLPAEWAGRYDEIVEPPATAEGRTVDPLPFYLLLHAVPHALAVQAISTALPTRADSIFAGAGLIDALWSRTLIDDRDQRFRAAVEKYSLCLAIRNRQPVSDDVKNAIASLHSNRGIARASVDDPAGAIDDHTAAIDIRTDLRTLLEPAGQWQPEFRNDLATAHSNRGTARDDLGDPAGAIRDHTAAIHIMTGLRTLLEPAGQWQPQFRNDLATAHSNRGIARADLGDPAGAIDDHTAAIDIRTGLRTLLEPAGQWHLPLRIDLVKSLIPCAMAEHQSGASSAARGHAAEAVGILEDLKARLPAGAWSAQWEQFLAMAREQEAL